VALSYQNRPRAFGEATLAQWNDWHWQHANRLRDLDSIGQVVRLKPDEIEAFHKASDTFLVALTPYYASLIDPDDGQCPIRQQALPQLGELTKYEFELSDPLAEDSHMPVAGVTHRYDDRVLFYVSHHCPVYCRHCTRKRKVADPKTAASKTQIDAGLAYISATPEVRDVLVSGGDPLTLSDERLAYILEGLRKIDHVDVIRLGTRNPVTLPQRIDAAFCEMIARFRPLYVHTHFNHPRELTEEATRALTMLLDAGCVLGNQMVLLRGINDDVETVLALNRGLLRAGCRPYYILQCDMAQGITHFRTPLHRGVEIIEGLRGRIGGMGIPDFVVDLPGGGGKVELAPNPIVGTQEHVHGRVVTFRNHRGEHFPFVDVDPGSAER
jgi:lysine 2,3-aminomutase